MADVASLEHCKELYELSGWDNTDTSWYKVYNYETRAHSDIEAIYAGDASEATGISSLDIPAYNLGYLLRKLLAVSTVVNFIRLSNGKVTISYNPSKPDYNNYESDSSEDAAAKLAIELFKQGILKKEQS